MIINYSMAEGVILHEWAKYFCKLKYLPTSAIFILHSQPWNDVLITYLNCPDTCRINNNNCNYITKCKENQSYK